MESASNRRAVALLREHISPAQLPTPDDDALGTRLRDALDEQVRTAIRLDPGHEPNGGAAILEALRQWGIEHIDISFGRAIFEALRVRIPGSRPLYNDVLPTLAELQRRGFLLGVVTNRQWGGKPFREDLETLGLLEYFQYHHMAISADLGVRKPNPAIFQHALNALSVAPEQAVMVGDSLRADIVGAQRLGIFTIWKPKPGMREQAQLVMHGASAKANAHTQQAHTQAPGNLTAPVDTPPPGIHITDDDFVLAQVHSRNGELDAYIRGNITPDLIIENTGDLLGIFSKAGKQ
jgi:HAD superfamily hydrolase (TIGR01549 family)